MQALLCASYGCEVDVVDPNTRSEFQYMDCLRDHPCIHRYVVPMEDFVVHKKYNLIICLNVIPFMDKKRVLNEFLPSIKSHLHPG
jgi:hypothetical protein